MLWKHDIGFSDIAKFHFGMDHQLPKGALGKDAADALRKLIIKISPRYLAFTSLNAGRKIMGKNAVAGELSEKLGDTRVFILPSPSPLAANHWDIEPWRDLAKAVKQLS